MEVEDRHLNVMVDLINKAIDSGEHLFYFTEQFNPTDIVRRLAQLIIIYENNVLSESPFLPILETDPYSEPNYCLTIGSVVKLWLLDFYKQDCVTLNILEIESGFGEEIVLTTLMVLRVLYRMRQLMDPRLHTILTQEWKDLHEFDQELDQRFDMKCIRLMSLLVKHSINQNIKTNAFLKQINGLKEENKALLQRVKTLEESCGSVSTPTSSPARITTLCIQSMDSNMDEREVSPLSQQTVVSEDPIESQIKLMTRSPIRLRNSSPNKSKISVNPIIDSNERERLPIRASPSRLPRSPTPKPISPKKSLKEPLITRRSPRISTKISNTCKNSHQLRAEKAFQEIRALFSEDEDSETENFEEMPKKCVNKGIKPLKQNPTEPDIKPTITALKSLTKDIPLPLKKRKPKYLSSSPMNEVSVQQNECKVDVKPKKTLKVWPSKSKNYPRKRRYPCNHPNCMYIADRPSTLVRHCRAHTGEKPFVCDFPGCDKRYKMSSNLTPHKLTHTGEKPYACDWADCEKRFTYPQHLKRHIISHLKRDRLRRSQLMVKSVTDSKQRLKQKLIAITST